MSQGDGGGARTENVQKYTTAKRAWSRMASFVNYEDKSRGYSGDKLARKYVLQGGTLFQDTNDDKSFGLRYGVGQKNGAYGSDLGNRQLGLRPMPGIESITIQNKSAYGSLRQATIKYKAWDKAQLEDLEILYMRMKYPVLLEWGWSMYMNTYKEGSTYTDVSDKGSLIVSDTELNRLANSPIKSFIEPTIDPFDENQTQEDLYEKIKVLQHRFSGNYDGMLGFVENFTWELAPDGGFNCTTILISMGDVLASLKMNRPTPTKSEFDATSGYKSYFTQMLEDFVNNIPIPLRFPVTNPNIDVYQSNLDGVFTVGANKTAAKDSLHYIQLAYFIHLLNEKNNLYDGKDKKLIELEIPTESSTNRGNGLCLASEDSVSIDPSVCLIKNKKATFATGLPEGFDIGYELGKPPNTFVINRPEFNPNNTPTTTLPIPFINNTSSTTTNSSTAIPKDFLVAGEKAGRNFGIIGNIYVSVQCIRSLFEDMSSKKDVLFYEFMKVLMDKISYALGGINNFDIFVYENKGVIIDKNYTERSADATTDSKFKLNLFGNHTVVRNYKVLSKIFQSQATEVAVAASNRENLGSYNTSTQRALNRGLSNRLISRITLPEEGDNNLPDAVQEYKEKERVAKSVLDMQRYLQGFLHDRTFPSDSTSAANTILKSILLNVNEDTNYKSIIPIHLEATMDGIGGIDIGEIFTVEEGVLPKEYDMKHVGFIVVKESHTITSDWTTTLEGKVVLLDQNDVSKYTEIKLLKDSLTKIGDKLKDKELLDAQRQVLYYRHILALIKMYYEDYFQISTEVISETFEPNDLSQRSNSDIYESIRIRYIFLSLRKNQGTLILNYELGTTTFDIKASNLIGSLTDNRLAVENIKKYNSYAKLDGSTDAADAGYKPVGPPTTRAGKQLKATLSPLFGGGSYLVDSQLYKVSQGYTRLLGPFQANNNSQDIQGFLNELVTNTIYYKELTATKLKADIDEKINTISTALLKEGAKPSPSSVNIGAASIDARTKIEVTPFKAEQDEVSRKVSYVPDPKGKFTITYQ